MDVEIDKQVLSLCMRFYARALTYPYDELTYEFQSLFREMEKYISSDADNTLVATALDVINFYQGEDMITLQSEFVRLFTPREGEPPFISLQIQDLVPGIDIFNLITELEDSALFAEIEDEPELILNVMEYFSSLLEYETDEKVESFYEVYLKPSLPKLAEQVYNGAMLNFYKEYAKGLSEMVELLA